MNNSTFDRCNLVYFKTSSGLGPIFPFLKGKIVISENKDIGDMCNLRGIIHVYNTEKKFPDEKIDCIICGRKDTELEARLIKLEKNIPVVYLGEVPEKWCGSCNVSRVLGDSPVNKYCSEKCLNENSKFMKNFKMEKDLAYSDVKSRQYRNNVVITFDKDTKTSTSTSTKKVAADKFQASIVKDAVRLDYAIKRVMYKKEIRQESMRKTSVSSSRKREKGGEGDSSNLCKGKTKKGERCTNKSINGSNYCGIVGHSLGQ